MIYLSSLVFLFKMLLGNPVPEQLRLVHGPCGNGQSRLHTDKMTLLRPKRQSALAVVEGRVRGHAPLEILNNTDSTVVM